MVLRCEQVHVATLNCCRFLIILRPLTIHVFSDLNSLAGVQRANLMHGRAQVFALRVQAVNCHFASTYNADISGGHGACQGILESS